MFLELINSSKTRFDINSKSHISRYRYFLLESTWGKDCCPFILEFPYASIPDMIKDKLVRKYITNTVEL